MHTPLETNLARQRTAREVARAAGSFEHLLTGRVPTRVMIVADGDWMVVSLSEAFSTVERRLAANGQSAHLSSSSLWRCFACLFGCL